MADQERAPALDLAVVPIDILLMVFSWIDHDTLISLRCSCRSLYIAVQTYLSCHTSITVTNRPNTLLWEERQRGLKRLQRFSLDHFLAAISHSKPIADSIQHLEIELWYNYRLGTPALPRNLDTIKTAICHAIRVKNEEVVEFSRAGDNRNLHSQTQLDIVRWPLFITLMCRNLTSLTITSVDSEALGWLATAQYLFYTTYPHHTLKHLNVSWPRSKTRGNGYRTHDLQDIWLVFTAPGLATIDINGLRQGNNLYTGGTDRQFLRTTYWPIELEGASLFHHNYLSACQAVDQSTRVPGWTSSRPDTIGTARKIPIEHDYKHLEAVSFRNVSLMETWWPCLLPTFSALKRLEIDMVFANVDRRSTIPDLRLLNMGLEAVAGTLEEFRFDIQSYGKSVLWADIARAGGMSFERLAGMLRLKVLKVPWFVLLRSRDRFEAKGITLPTGLEELTLNRCELVRIVSFAEMVTAWLEDLPALRLTMTAYGQLEADTFDVGELRRKLAEHEIEEIPYKWGLLDNEDDEERRQLEEEEALNAAYN